MQHGRRPSRPPRLIAGQRWFAAGSLLSRESLAKAMRDRGCVCPLWAPEPLAELVDIMAYRYVFLALPWDGRAHRWPCGGSPDVPCALPVTFLYTRPGKFRLRPVPDEQIERLARGPEVREPTVEELVGQMIRVDEGVAVWGGLGGVVQGAVGLDRAAVRIDLGESTRLAVIPLAAVRRP
uniref:Uncharacterized protein n=2 Tax=viral metagenome TaxID=1070528 RepID=A0A6M3M5N7_9ZZZZ